LRPGPPQYKAGMLTTWPRHLVPQWGPSIHHILEVFFEMWRLQSVSKIIYTHTHTRTHTGIKPSKQTQNSLWESILLPQDHQIQLFVLIWACTVCSLHIFSNRFLLYFYRCWYSVLLCTTRK
jgi:hypothetical protein